MGNKGGREPDARKGTRNLRETWRERERGDAWRTGTHSKERTGESRGGKWKRGNGERSPRKRETTKGLLGAMKSSTRERKCLRGRTGTGPCGVSRGGCSPMCRTPCCSHLVPFSTVAAPLLLVINHCGAFRSADSGFRRLSRTPNQPSPSQLNWLGCHGWLIVWGRSSRWAGPTDRIDRW